jgi:hypothetical protein
VTSATPAEAARVRASRLYPRAPHFAKAYRAGAKAARDGRPASACPYSDRGRETYRRSWRLAWMRGHASEGVSLDDLDR